MIYHEVTVAGGGVLSFLRDEPHLKVLGSYYIGRGRHTIPFAFFSFLFLTYSFLFMSSSSSLFTVNNYLLFFLAWSSGELSKGKGKGKGFFFLAYVCMYVCTYYVCISPRQCPWLCMKVIRILYIIGLAKTNQNIYQALFFLAASPTYRPTYLL
ncbi:hypothetical protein F4809DRAFT_470480 [Biscogniauxia mediterranea]|nr:hypothetical protein F4809DRAFT_470480 [Biscogniauxia mediterranea]